MRPTETRKRIEILIGALGWYLVNGLIWFMLFPGPFDTRGPYGALGPELVSLIMMPANLLVLVVCAIIPRLRRVALGILIALALNFAVSILLGMGLNASCFIPFIHK